MAHNLFGLLESYDKKTCFIGHNPSLYVHDRCIVVCFADVASKLAAVSSVPVYKSVNLCWAGLSLACCANCKQFGYVSDVCLVGRNYGVHCKQMISFQDQAPVAYPVFFGEKTWAQIAGGSLFHVALSAFFGVGLFLGAKLLVMASNPLNNSGLADYMTSLEHSVELLSDQISKILRKLSFVELVLLSFLSCVLFSIVASSSNLALNSDIVVDSMVVLPSLSPLVVGNTGPKLSLSNSKILTTKVGGLKSKIMALKVLVDLVLTRLDFFNLVWKVATYNVRGMNNLAKQNNIICWHKDMNNLISIITETKLKDKIFFTSGLNSGHMGFGVVIIMNISLAQHVCKVSEVLGQLLSIKLLFKNKLSMSILGLYAGVSLVIWFFQISEINSFIAKAVNKFFFIILNRNFNEDGLHKCTSFKRCLDLGLVNSLLGSLVVKVLMWENSRDVKKTIDYVLVSFNLVNAVLECSVMDVSEYFNTNYQAISVLVGLDGLLDVQLNSFYKQINKDCWKFNFKKNFKNAMLVNAGMFSDKFTAAVKFSDLNAMWDNFDSVFTKVSSKFYKLELLVLKIVKASYKRSVVSFNLINSGVISNHVYSVLFDIRKSYHVSKFAESLTAKEANIKAAIDKKMESFETNKMVLNYLVVNDELILEPDLVKFKVDIIMKDWTRKHDVIANVSDIFSGVMYSVEFSELLDVIFNLPNGKAAGLLGITNELWKHCNKSILDMLLVLLNFCLSCESWKGVLINIHPIALIKTTYKILSKILSDRISLACSTFDILYGDNFLSSIFAIGLVVEDTLEKNWELWLVLQNMQKAYNSVSWEHLKKSLLVIECSLALFPLSESKVASLVSFANSGGILDFGTDSLSVYTDGFLNGLDTVGCRAGTATFFKDIDLGLGIGMSGLMSSTFAELPEDFQSLKNSTQQQEPILTSTNIIEYLQENESNYSKNLESEETESEQKKTAENEEEMATAYIAKIPEFTGEDNDISPQEWFNKVQKAGDTNSWNTARMLKAIPYFLQGTAEEWFENLGELFENWQAFKDVFLQQFTDNNISITLCNCFCNIKQETSETILNQFIARLKDKLIKKVCLHASADLATAIKHAKNYKIAIEETNYTKLVNLAIRETTTLQTNFHNNITKTALDHHLTTNLKIVIIVESQNTGNEIAGNCKETNKTGIIYVTLHYNNLITNLYYQLIIHQDHKIKMNNNNKINSNNQLVLRNSGQQKPNHYYTQPNYLTIPEGSDFQQSVLSKSEVTALRSNSSNNTILLAQILQNANLSDIFPFEFEANESPFLLSNAAVNEQKAITAMYTKAEVEGKPIRLILDNRSAKSIITYQLIQQLQRTVDRPAQTVIVTADGIKKTPVEEIDNFPFTIDGITIPVKVLYSNLKRKKNYQPLKPLWFLDQHPVGPKKRNKKSLRKPKDRMLFNTLHQNQGNNYPISHSNTEIAKRNFY
ncbi:hypothetical protein G9A89_021222 [Geosiphon pyriformis]|nr:hypothetical protein G9A89_021222 [Geosiphon pyriformis]